MQADNCGWCGRRRAPCCYHPGELTAAGLKSRKSQILLLSKLPPPLPGRQAGWLHSPAVGVLIPYVTLIIKRYFSPAISLRAAPTTLVEGPTPQPVSNPSYRHTPSAHHLQQRPPTMRSAQPGDETTTCWPPMSNPPRLSADRALFVPRGTENTPQDLL